MEVLHPADRKAQHDVANSMDRRALDRAEPRGLSQNSTATTMR